jgi:hypothetical protein
VGARGHRTDAADPADDQDSAIVEQGGRLAEALMDHLLTRRPQAGGGIKEQWRVGGHAHAPQEEDPTVAKQRRGVTGPAGWHCAGPGPLLTRGIEQLGAREASLLIVTAGDEDLAVTKEGCR